MSVALECQIGDEFVCIQDFYATPKGVPFSWETCRHFRVGERLRFAGVHQDSYARENSSPTSWMIEFDAADGSRYQATQTYFVTDECWSEIETYFILRNMDEAKRQAKDARIPASAVG